MERKASTARSDLEQLLVDETAEPKALPLSLLEDITGDFSDDQEIGRGGFAVVYKGILGDRAVAVKKLCDAFMDERVFHREVACLMRVKHKNVVRFLGYCADRQGNMAWYDGKLVMADVHQRLLCFEYIPKGSLDKYIKDAHREWGTSYKIIKGVCEGLQYLHENRIIHLDLKPANILLDDNMVPKITDFGLSRCFDENQSRDITKTISGTMGYVAPEHREGGVIACSADLYSLGIIIVEILTGKKAHQDTEDVLESWSDRLERSQQEEIRICYETALECTEFNPKKRPASARDIIDRFHEMESILTAEAASSTAGVAATESKGKSNTDDLVFRFVPAAGRGPHPLAGQTVVVPRLTDPAAVGPAGPYHEPQDDRQEAFAAASSDPVASTSRALAAESKGESKDEPRHATATPQQPPGQTVVMPCPTPAQEAPPGSAYSLVEPMSYLDITGVGSVNQAWSEEFMFVASEPFDDPLVVTVEEKVATGRDEPIGRIIIPVASPHVPRNDLAKSVPSKWFNLSRGMTVDEARPPPGTKHRESSKTIASKIHLCMSLETAYHVLDEPMHYSSDLQPAAEMLRKSAIGILEVGILNARGLDVNKNPYCVARYGAKWVRTRTLLGTAAPAWNERYTWEVFDLRLSTVITVAVFDNNHLHHGHDAKDQRIGKVRVHLATLESDRGYTHYFPLMTVTPSGLKKTGELHLAVRFTCTAWDNMLAQDGQPLLPEMHYTNPISVPQLDDLRFQAMQMVATELGWVEPPLHREVVEYMLDVDTHMFSLHRSKANINRITSLFFGAVTFCAVTFGEWFDGIRKWEDPLATIHVHALFLGFVCYPELIVPTVFLCLLLIGVYNYRWHPDTMLSQAELTHPNVLDEEFHGLLWCCKDQAYPDELDKELDLLPTAKPDDIVVMRYDRLRGLAGSVQTVVVGYLARQAQQARSLLSWRYKRLTAIFITLLLVMAVILYLTPLRAVAMVMGLYVLRHPELRGGRSSRLPSPRTT